MRRNSFSRLHWLLFAIFLFVNIKPAEAAWNSSAPSLAGLQLGFTYYDVISKKGTPTYIGPSVQSVVDINEILNPIARTTVTMKKMPTKGPTPKPAPTVPSLPGGLPGRAAPPTQKEPLTEDKDPTKFLKGRQPFLIWLYEDEKANGIYTFVVFDIKSGVVTDIISWKNIPTTKYTVSTTSKVNLGDAFDDLITIYGNSNPYRRLGQYILCSYKPHQFTFCVDSATGKIIGITLSKRELILLPGSLATKEEIEGKNTKAKNKLPALPGGRILPK